MIITVIPREHIPREWPRVEPLLKMATDTRGGQYHPFDIFDKLIDGELQLWGIFNEERELLAVLTTRVFQYRNSRALSIDWVGGSQMKSWLPAVIERLKDFAKTNGCKTLEGRGRSGWLRALKKHGWETDYVAIKMELEDE
jgi:hypothetical protein